MIRKRFELGGAVPWVRACSRAPTCVCVEFVLELSAEDFGEGQTRAAAFSQTP